MGRAERQRTCLGRRFAAAHRNRLRLLGLRVKLNLYYFFPCAAEGAAVLDLAECPRVSRVRPSTSDYAAGTDPADQRQEPQADRYVNLFAHFSSVFPGIRTAPRAHEHTTTSQ